MRVIISREKGKGKCIGTAGQTTGQEEEAEHIMTECAGGAGAEGWVWSSAWQLFFWAFYPGKT